MGMRLGTTRGGVCMRAFLWCCGASFPGLLSAAMARADDFAVYVGANFGRALNSYDTGYIDQQYVSQATANGDSLDIDSRSVHRFDDVWWCDGGYFFTPYVALDAAFLHLGEVRYKTSGVVNEGGIDDVVATTTEVTSRGPALSLLGRLPLTDSFEADLRLGDYIGKSVFYNRIDVLAQSSLATSSRTTSSLLVGVGGAYTFAGHWAFRLDYLRADRTGDRVAGGKFTVNVASAGASFTF